MHTGLTANSASRSHWGAWNESPGDKVGNHGPGALAIFELYPLEVMELCSLECII